MSRTWSGELLDAEEAAQKNPEMFSRPNRTTLVQLVEGDLVRVELLAEPNEEGFEGERVWLKVVRVDEEWGYFVGRIMGTALFMTLEPEQMVAFELRHVLEAMLR